MPSVKTLPQLYQLKAAMQEFDQMWCIYEQAYIGELMVIERDARRFVFDMVAASDTKSFVKAISKLSGVLGEPCSFNPEVLVVAR